MSSGIEYVDLGIQDGAIISLVVRGKITGDDMAGFIRKVEGVRAEGRKARLYIDLADYDGYEFPVVKEKLMHMSTLWNGIERCAYVVDRRWMSQMIGLVDAVTPMHLRAFGVDESAAAKAWVVSAIPPWVVSGWICRWRRDALFGWGAVEKMFAAAITPQVTE